MNLTAYRVHDTDMSLVPAGRSREWMDALPERYANRCLPLRMANEAGWWLLNSESFEVRWNGGQHQSCLLVDYGKGGGFHPFGPAGSHFGGGILTFSIPYLFRTADDYNLLVRGPANMPKVGASPLEGLVETDWAPYTATMNWQITAINEPVYFEAGEPIAQIVPQRRGELEEFEPECKRISKNWKLRAEYQAWTQGRDAFLKQLRASDPDAKKRGWQKDYFQGRGAGAAEHQTKLQLTEFVHEPTGGND